MAKRSRKTAIIHRSSITGKFVTKRHAKTHPHTTQSQRVRQ